MPDQEGLEAVAEAQENAWQALNSLYDAIRPLDGSMPDMAIIDTVAERCWPILKAALAASRQPVSGGPEGEVEKAARWLWDYDTSGNDGAWDETEREEYRDTAKDLLAALSRVPADGEQPAGSTDLHELDLERRGIIPPSPSDGPVSDGEEENQHDGNQGLDEWVTKRND